LKASEKFLNRLLGPQRSDKLRGVTQPFDALAQLMPLLVTQCGEADVVPADFFSSLRSGMERISRRLVKVSFGSS
jgi:hypothetical protein